MQSTQVVSPCSIWKVSDFAQPNITQLRLGCGYERREDGRCSYTDLDLDGCSETLDPFSEAKMDYVIMRYLSFSRTARTQKLGLFPHVRSRDRYRREVYHGTDDCAFSADFCISNSIAIPRRWIVHVHQERRRSFQERARQ